MLIFILLLLGLNQYLFYLLSEFDKIIFVKYATIIKEEGKRINK